MQVLENAENVVCIANSVHPPSKVNGRRREMSLEMSLRADYRKRREGLKFNGTAKGKKQGGVTDSDEASPTIGHTNANFSVFIDRTRNQYRKK